MFKETKLNTENATNCLAQYTTICIHVSNLLILVLRHTKEKVERIQFLHFNSMQCNFFLCSGHATVLGSSAKMFPMHYNAIILGLEQTTTTGIFVAITCTSMDTSFSQVG